MPPRDDMSAEVLPPSYSPASSSTDTAQILTAAKDRAQLIADDDPVSWTRTASGLEVLVTGIDDAVRAPDLGPEPSAGCTASPPASSTFHSTSMAERGILLTNSAGAYATAMAEYALAAMIMLARNLPAWLEGQRDRRWLEGDSFEASCCAASGSASWATAPSAASSPRPPSARDGGLGHQATPVRLGDRSIASSCGRRSTSSSSPATSSCCAPRSTRARGT